jgi:outer membrane protein OmpA-like peptidoglycan-associated protein
VSSHPDAQQVAGDELADATEALQNAEHLQANNGDYDDIYHHAYLALRNAEIAKERIAEADARERIESSEAERTRILLAAREAEANQAIRQAERSELEAELAEERAEIAIAQQLHLRATLLELEAEKTDRGYVLTLSDILFDTDKAVLKPGAQKTMDTLAEFLREYPEHRLLIEGHTDSRGTDAYNIALSESRGNTVRLALIDRGIDPGRLEIAAMGESYPLASNDTSAGMQENRRVEIIFSDTEGNFPAAATRTASNN